LAVVEDVLQKSPANAEAWKLKGDILLFAKGQADEAVVAYRQAVVLRAGLFWRRTPASFLFIFSKGNLPKPAARLKLRKKVAPNHPQTKFLAAQLAYRERSYKTARELVQQILKVAPDNSKAMHLAGAVELQLNSLVQAEAYLSKAVQKEPDAPTTRRLLIMTYLRMGQSTKALAALQPSLSKQSLDPEFLSLAGEVYLQSGDLRKAEEYFAKAAKADPKDARKRTSLALTRLVGGEVDAAFGELQQIAASDASPTADLALISAYLRRYEFDKALRAIDGLEKKQPGKPFAANLRGRTYLARNDSVAAGKALKVRLQLTRHFSLQLQASPPLTWQTRSPLRQDNDLRPFSQRTPRMRPRYLP